MTTLRNFVASANVRSGAGISLLPASRFRLRPLTITLPGGIVKQTSALIDFTGQVTNTGSAPAFVAALIRPLIGGVAITAPPVDPVSGRRQTLGTAVPIAPGATVTVAASVTVFSTDPVGPVTAVAELWAGSTASTLAITGLSATSGALGTVDPATGLSNFLLAVPVTDANPGQLTQVPFFYDWAGPGALIAFRVEIKNGAVVIASGAFNTTPTAGTGKVMSGAFFTAPPGDGLNHFTFYDVHGFVLDVNGVPIPGANVVAPGALRIVDNTILPPPILPPNSVVPAFAVVRGLQAAAIWAGY